MHFSQSDYSCKRDLCRRAVSLWMSVSFVYSVEMSKHNILIFLLSGRSTILVFPYQTLWQLSNGNYPDGASSAGGVGKNRNPRPISALRSMTGLVSSVDNSFDRGVKFIAAGGR